MKRPQQSRGSVATKSAEQSIGCSSGTTQTKPDNPTVSNGSGAIGTIDPNDTSYFIQYQPELAEKLSQHNSTYSVSGRCLSIVASRMIYWSRYAKHRYNGKLYFWKNQTELSEETGFSIKQINRALKVLVELGLIIREKFQKHRYFQCYFYHIPVSPHTKELKDPPRTSSRNSSSSRRGSSGLGRSQPQQQFHCPSGGGAVSAEPVRGTQSARSSKTTAAPSAAAAVPAAATPSKINRGKGFKSISPKCPNHSITNSSSIKLSLLSIVEKCEMYGREDIYRERFISAPE